MLLIEVTDREKIIYINIDAIDSIFQDSSNTYGILLRSGIVYSINKNEYDKLIFSLKEIK